MNVCQHLKFVKYVFVALISFNSFNLCAQETCITLSPPPPSWIFQNSTSQKSIRSYSITDIITLKVFVHIVRSSNGQGLNMSISSTIISNLNNSFASSNIQFSLVGSDFIDNDYFYENLNGKESQLFSTNSQTNSINIYVLGTSTVWQGAGLAQNIPAVAYIVHGNYYNTSSLPHEMGHCLGLYHTHHGTVTESGGDVNQCSELVNGSNSMTCGDYISDTRADPNVWSYNSCNYVGTTTDSNGQSYNPDPSNLMSYSYKPCRTLFTPLQSERMRNFIENTQILQNVIRYEISGPSQICSEDTFSINNWPAGATWSSSNTSKLILSSGQGTASALFTKTGNGRCNVNATISIGGNSFTINKNVSVGVPDRPWLSNGGVISTYASASYDLCIGQRTTSLQLFFIKPSTSADVTDWQVQKTLYPSNFQLVQNGDNVFVNPLQAGLGQFTVKAVNSCGVSSVVTVYLTINTCNNPTPIDPPGLPIDDLILYSNPASEVVTASVTTTEADIQDSQLLLDSTDSTSTTPYEGEYDIQLWSETSGLIKTLHANQPTIQIPLHGLTKGMYYVHLITKGKTAQRKILWVK